MNNEIKIDTMGRKRKAEKFQLDKLGRKRKNGKVYSSDPKVNIMSLSSKEKSIIDKMRENEKKIGEQYLPFYQGVIDLFIDSDGTEYSVNQHLAQYHYRWSHGSFGLGYYLQTED